MSLTFTYLLTHTQTQTFIERDVKYENHVISYAVLLFLCVPLQWLGAFKYLKSVSVPWLSVFKCLKLESLPWMDAFN